MADRAVVVGGGPGALRTAAGLRDSGRSVILLQEGPHPGGFVDVDVPIERGIGRGPTGPSVFGDLVAVEGLDRAVMRNGKRVPLPMKPNHVFRLMNWKRHPAAASQLARARGKRELHELIGGGQEVRSYRDWVAARYGAPVYEDLYAPYCRKRFGDPEELTCNVSRLVHAGARSEAPVAPREGPASAVKSALAGLDVRVGAVLRSIAPGLVTTQDGSVEGDVYVDLPPARVCELLGAAAPEGLHATVGKLRHRHLVQVVVRGGRDLPFETHILDEKLPFYRITRPGRLPGCSALADDLIAHYSLDDADPLWRADDAEVVRQTLDALGSLATGSSSGRVVRIANHHPVWVTTHATAMRTFVLALDELGIAPIGRSGLFTPLEWEQEIGWLAALTAAESSGEGVRSRMRRWMEPPIGDEEGPAPLVRFIER